MNSECTTPNSVSYSLTKPALKECIGCYTYEKTLIKEYTDVFHAFKLERLILKLKGKQHCARSQMLHITEVFHAQVCHSMRNNTD